MRESRSGQSCKLRTWARAVWWPLSGVSQPATSAIERRSAKPDAVRRISVWTQVLSHRQQVLGFAQICRECRSRSQTRESSKQFLRLDDLSCPQTLGAPASPLSSDNTGQRSTLLGKPSWSNLRLRYWSTGVCRSEGRSTWIDGYGAFAHLWCSSSSVCRRDCS